MNTIPETIVATIAALHKIQAIVTAEPAFSDWGMCGPFTDPRHVQLFPRDDMPRENVKRSARIIALALAPVHTWEIDGDKWRSHWENMDFVLHRVEFVPSSSGLPLVFNQSVAA